MKQATVSTSRKWKQMILDATAGNRTMWQEKESDNIIYIDVEMKLQVKPTMFCDNTCTPFKSKTFDTIFYDPPHTWGQRKHYHSYPYATEEYVRIYKQNVRIPTRYYGWDKFKNQTGLIRHIYLAQEEFRRILKDDGLLWVKWNEMSIQLIRILSLFNKWTPLLKLFISAPSQTGGEHQTYWLCMEKIKEADDVQKSIIAYGEDEWKRVFHQSTR